MLVFNCTKAAADFFTTTRKGKKMSPLSPPPKLALTDEPCLHDHMRWHWMVHAKKFSRKNVLVVVDTESRFCMVFWGLKKGDVQAFLEQFHERLWLHLTALIQLAEEDESVLEAGVKTFLQHHNQYAFLQRGDRSVQGHINDMFFGIECERYYWECDEPGDEELFITDLKQNDTPRKRKQDKDYIFPYCELFQTWLPLYTSLDKNAIEHAIKRYQEKHRELWAPSFDMDIDVDSLEELIDMMMKNEPLPS